MTLFEGVAVAWMVATVVLLLAIGRVLGDIRNELQDLKQKAASLSAKRP